MKKILLPMFLVLLLAVTVYALTSSYSIDNVPNGEWWSGSRTDTAWRWAQEIETILEEDAVLFNPTDTVPTATEGKVYYNDSDETMYVYTTSSGWRSLDMAGASSLGTAYAAGSPITVDTDAITLTSTDAADNEILALVHAETGNYSALSVTNASAYPAIQVTSTGAGADITGTSATWAVSSAGVASIVGLVVTTEDIELENGAEIQNVVDTEIMFLEDNGVADEDIIFDFTENAVNLKSGTGVVTLAMGTVDDLTGVGNIAFDAAAGGISLAGTTNAFDLTISQTGTVDSSLILQSAGSVSDALSLITSDAVGSIKIASSDLLDIDAADDITINTADGTFTLTVDGATDGDLVIDAEDKITIVSTDAQHAGIYLHANGGTGEGIHLHSDQGTGVSAAAESDASIQLESDVGGIGLLSQLDAADAIRLETNAGTSEGIILHSNQGTSVTEGSASVQLLSDAGGICLESNSNLASAILLVADGGTTETIMIQADQGTSVTEGAAAITLLADDGGICLHTETNLAKAIQLVADGGTSETIYIQADQGTGAGSITLLSDGGGIDITAEDLDTGDILIDANDNLTLLSSSIAAAGIYVHADGGTLETIVIHADQGTDDASIYLDSDVGGITLNANAGSIDIEAVGGTDGDIILNSGDDMTLTTAGKLTITNTEPVTISGAFEPDIVHVPDGAAYDVLANNSGQDHLIPAQGADMTMDLPAEADGLHYRFVYVGGAEDAEDWIIDSENNTNFFIGGLMTIDDDDHSTLVVYSDGSDDSIIKIDTPGAGTVVEIWCDGTNWFITGIVISGTDTAVAFSNL